MEYSNGNLWFRPSTRFRPYAVDSNENSEPSANPTTKYKRRLLVKHAIFRGDPREFLG